MMLVKTYTPQPQDIDRQWLIVDAEGQTLGRLASRIAPILRGKHKPTFAPNIDVGDYVIVINVDKIVVTGKKLDEKMYHRHSGYPGGLTSITLRDNMRRFPERPLYEAVKGMLDKGALGNQQLKKLKIYAGTDHPHAGQKPTVLELEK
jgi:large subunit ribosomal protein L13